MARTSGEIPDLVVLVADQDTRRLVDGLIDRGQQAQRFCLGSFLWTTVAALGRDAAWRNAEELMRPFRGAHIVVCWDVAGSGAEESDPAEIEDAVVERLAGAGHRRDHVFALAFDPEVEAVLVPSWQRVCRVLASLRSVKAPADERLLTKARKRYPRLAWPDELDQALARYPKELFEELCHELRLPRTPAIYERLAKELSLPRLKKSVPAKRLASRLEAWFPQAVG